MIFMENKNNEPNSLLNHIHTVLKNLNNTYTLNTDQNFLNDFSSLINKTILSYEQFNKLDEDHLNFLDFLSNLLANLFNNANCLKWNFLMFCYFCNLISKQELNFNNDTLEHFINLKNTNDLTNRAKDIKKFIKNFLNTNQKIDLILKITSLKDLFADVYIKKNQDINNLLIILNQKENNKHLTR